MDESDSRTVFTATARSTTYGGPDLTRTLIQAAEHDPRLQVPVGVSVTLATARQSLAAILALRPGSVLRFDKPCSAPLMLEIGQRSVGRGECVRIGDRFGLRITTLDIHASEK